jgi:hypothetical protein
MGIMQEISTTAKKMAPRKTKSISAKIMHNCETDLLHLLFFLATATSSQRALVSLLFWKKFNF